MQLSAAEREKSDLAQKASDAQAEEEILQARISELTAENATVQAEKCDLMSKIEELVEQKATAETINAELVQEKQLGDTKKGTDEKKRIGFQYDLCIIFFRNGIDCYESSG